MEYLKIISYSYKGCFTFAVLTCLPLYLQDFKLIYILIASIFLILGTLQVLLFLFLKTAQLNKEKKEVIINRNGLIEENSKLKKQLDANRKALAIVNKRNEVILTYIPNKQTTEILNKLRLIETIGDVTNDTR